MAQNLMASIAFSQTVMVSLPMMAEIAQMTVIAIPQTYRNGFHFYESRQGQNYVEGCNSQQIDRNGFYSYENRNGFSSSRNGLFPSQGHIGYHQGRNGYAQTFNNPSATCRQNYGNQPNYNYSGQNTHNEHGWAAANQQGNSNSFISGCEEPKPRLPIFTGKGDWKSFFLQFELHVGGQIQLVHGQEERRDHLLLKGRSPIFCDTTFCGSQNRIALLKSP